MSTHAQTPAPAPPAPVTAPPRPAAPARRFEADSWSRGDKIGVAMAWGAGILLCLVAAAIVLYMFFRGIQYLDLPLLVTHPQVGLDQSKTGGFLDPIEGTVILTILGTLIAAPVGVGIAVWLSEYGRPSWLARAVESCIEIVAGTPSIVLAIFGLLVFQQGLFTFLSYEASAGVSFGRSFIIAGAIMSLIALPLVVGATREALQAIPAHVREASYALGKDRIATIRRVLLPASRGGIGTGVTLGMGRIVGDTAIVVVLLGATMQIDPSDSVPGWASFLPGWGLLTGTGSTLTTYVYNNSPAGEGGAPDKAYAAAFVLLLVVICLNFAVDLIARRKEPTWTR